MAARCQALRLAARALEQRLNTDTSDYVGPELPCPCGGVARYHGRHGKTFESELGPLHLKRAYYDRSEEHTSELQSRLHLVCRLLLEKKKIPLTIISLTVAVVMM